jgi:hypothetical protein
MRRSVFTNRLTVQPVSCSMCLDTARVAKDHGEVTQKAFAVQVVQGPSAHAGASITLSHANEADFLAAIGDPSHRQALRELFATVSAFDLIPSWKSKGASIRLPSQDR